MGGAYFAARHGMRLAQARLAFWWFFIGPEGRRRSERIAATLRRWYGLGWPAPPRSVPRKKRR